MSVYIILTMLITLFAKLFGFARELVLSYFFGAGQISDAYLISLTIPGTIFQFVGTGLATSFIPIYLKAKASKDEKSSIEFTNSVTSAILIFATVITLIVWIFGDKVVLLFASGFSGETLEYAVLFTKINISSLYLATFVYVFSSYLQANEKILPVQFSVIPYSVIMLISIALGASVNVILLPIGSVLASFVQLVVLLFFVLKEKYRFRFSFNYKTEEFSGFCRILVPVIIGVSINDINILVDRTMASNIATGAISALAYSYSLTMFIQGVFVQPITNIYYPKITRASVEKNKDDFSKLINEGLLGILFFLVPICIYCIFSSDSIISMLYGRGAFDGTAIHLTSQAFIGYALSFIGVGIREFLSRIFYAIQNTKVPTINAGIGGVINIGLNILLSRWFGIFGLALATSISAIVTSILLYGSLHKRKIFRFSKDFIVQIIKVTFSSAVMIGIVFIARNVVINLQNTFLCFGLEVLIGSITFIIMCALLRVNLIQLFITNVKRRINRA